MLISDDREVWGSLWCLIGQNLQGTARFRLKLLAGTTDQDAVQTAIRMRNKSLCWNSRERSQAPKFGVQTIESSIVSKKFGALCRSDKRPFATISFPNPIKEISATFDLDLLQSELIEFSKFWDSQTNWVNELHLMEARIRSVRTFKVLSNRIWSIFAHKQNCEDLYSLDHRWFQIGCLLKNLKLRSLTKDCWLKIFEIFSDRNFNERNRLIGARFKGTVNFRCGNL